MIKNDNIKYYNSLNYSFEDITFQKDRNIEEENFKYNLIIILELIKPLMKKEEYITLNISNNITNNESKLFYSKRNLGKESINYFGIEEESFFFLPLFGVNLQLNLKNDLGLGKLRTTKITSSYIQGLNIEELSNYEIFTDINDALNEFINLSKAGNKMAHSLYSQLNESFINLKDSINLNINNLNNLLVFKDLSSIFDFSLSIENL